MKSISTFKDFGNVNHAFVVGRQRTFFQKEYEVAVRNGTQPYIYEFISESQLEITELFLQISKMLVTADSWEDFAKAVEIAKENKRIP